MVKARGLHSYKDSILGIRIKGRKSLERPRLSMEAEKEKSLLAVVSRAQAVKECLETSMPTKILFIAFLPPF